MFHFEITNHLVFWPAMVLFVIIMLKMFKPRWVSKIYNGIMIDGIVVIVILIMIQWAVNHP